VTAHDLPATHSEPVPKAAPSRKGLHLNVDRRGLRKRPLQSLEIVETALTSAPTRVAGRAPPVPHETLIQFRSCIGSPLQHPGPLTPLLQTGLHPRYFLVTFVCVFVFVSYKRHTAYLPQAVCVLRCFIKPILGNRYSAKPRLLRERTKGGTHPRFRVADLPSRPVLTLTTWAGRILTLHLMYVDGHTNPPLFLFERTQQP